jgi:beta-galactosidase/beta-glucuronidase
MTRLGAALALALAALLVAASAAGAAPPRQRTIDSGWQARDQKNDPTKPQEAPPEESGGEGEAPSAPQTGPTQDPSQNFSFRHATVPSVFDTTGKASLYPGEVRRYRLRFRGPATPPRFSWLVSFEEVRRAASVYLNGKLLGRNKDPYTPFAYAAKGLKPGKINELFVVVDSRKDPRLPEGWWNWGGIVRPVHLVPVGPAYLEGLGTMSKVSCKGAARRCRASLLLDGTLQRRGRRAINPVLDVRLRAPGGRTIRKHLRLGRLKGRSRRIRKTVKVPAPQLWSPKSPRLYSARVTLRNGGEVQQVVNRQVGLRSVTVKHGLIYLNNRRLNLRGAAIHEDMPGHGAALTTADMDRIVSDLKELGANVTRAHYLLNDRLLSRLDRAGIMVWNEAPIWQRDHRANLLQYPSQRRRAWLTVRRTVKAGRNHPSVITHSVANELSFTPDRKPGTRNFLTVASKYARDLDPTLPVTVDIKGRPGFPEQSTYENFDILGLNQYFGWYSWVQNFDDLPSWLEDMHETYPGRALVMTEFGSEGRPELAGAPPDKKGGYAFQAMHAGRTLDVVDRTPYLSGAIYWTMREFLIYPGWTGGAGRRGPPYDPNTMHQKGLLTYEGQRKPAWQVVHDHYARVPLYAARR